MYMYLTYTQADHRNKFIIIKIDVQTSCRGKFPVIVYKERDCFSFSEIPRNTCSSMSGSMLSVPAIWQSHGQPTSSAQISPRLHSQFRRREESWLCPPACFSVNQLRVERERERERNQPVLETIVNGKGGGRRI